MMLSSVTSFSFSRLAMHTISIRQAARRARGPQHVKPARLTTAPERLALGRQTARAAARLPRRERRSRRPHAGRRG